MADPGTSSLTLEQTAGLVAGHVETEEALFRLTGAWSTDPESASGPHGAAVQAFMATVSALHGWRAEQWQTRLPRSVEASADEASSRWQRVMAASAGAPDGQARIALWAVAFGPALADRYRGHRAACTDASDAGMKRWLDICSGDVQRSVSDATALLARCLDRPRAAPSLEAAAATLGELLLG